MKRHVHVHGRASRELKRYYRYLAKNAPITVARWLNRFNDAIDGLAYDAEKWPLAAEAERYQLELRIYPFGRTRNKFRVYFLIEDDTVHVLRITRGQRRDLRRDDLQNLD